MTLNLKHGISVCMITYNHEQYIAQAIEGVIMQKTNFPIEFIIANDASTDDTGGIIQNKINNLPQNIQIRYFSNTINKGMMQNYLFAIKNCTMKYIALCEGDDYWTDVNKLQRQFDLLENDALAGGIFHLTNLIKDDGTESIIGKDTNDLLNTEDIFSKYSLFHTSSLVFRNEIDFPEQFWKSVHWDMAFFSLVSTIGYLKRIPECMSVYRKHNKSITSGDLVIQNFRKERIHLMRLLDRYHGYKYHKIIDEIIQYHQSYLKPRNLKSSAISFLRRRLIPLFKRKSEKPII